MAALAVVPVRLPQTVAPPADGGFSALVLALQQAGFRGEVEDDPVLRAAASCDNSVYEIWPDAVIAPLDEDDVVTLLQVLDRPAFRHLSITARGGGTGTNGQSLNTGLIVDFRRHMHRILAIDAEAGWVEVEPGVVLDALNLELAPHNLFFAPETSTSSRCTIGGMVATDASGKGSRHYGKTSDNILGLTLLLAGGKCLDSTNGPMASDAFTTTLGLAVDDARTALQGRLPDLPRRFTGYDALGARRPDGALDWWRLPIGAEGTLGLVTRIRVQLRRKPAHRRLLVLGFTNFDAALRAGPMLLAHDPLAIEVMDGWVQSLAAGAGLLYGLPKSVQAPPGGSCSYTFVEFSGDDADALEASIAATMAEAVLLPGLLGAHRADGELEIGRLWSIRSAAVGLLAKIGGERRPLAFVEDCVVPVETLPAFVADFDAALRSRGLKYGIYGHVDVGCLHVRPALDIDRVADKAMMAEVSELVYQLTRKHGGIFWGEHGKGIRGAFLRDFVGAEAYAAFERIKSIFDPTGRFNPGKLVDPSGLYSLSSTPMRRMNAPQGSPFVDAYRCSGNGHCHSFDATTPLCPSFKASGDMRLSPKGRSDGLRVLQRTEVSAPEHGPLEAAVFDSLDKCLSCKACAGACPVRVDIPEMKSHFLADYYQRHRRPLADHAAVALEGLAPWLRPLTPLLAPLANLLMPPFGKLLGLVDLPKLQAWPRHAPPLLSVRQIAGRHWPDNTVLLLPDAFTALFDPEAILASVAGLRALGYEPLLVELMPGAKAAHVRGMQRTFSRRAASMLAVVKALSATRFPLIGVDPAFTLMFRQEYLRFGSAASQVLLPQEFLVAELQRGASWPSAAKQGAPGTLLLHCTENALGPGTRSQWRDIFLALNIPVTVGSAGCCGMAGMFGHQQRHQATSRTLFNLSWAAHANPGRDLLATGFSCRCQTERMGKTPVASPMARIAAAFHA